MEEKPAIDELLLRWEEALETDRPVSATELCRDRPELLGELQRRIALLQKVDGLLDLRRSTAELSGGPHPEPPAPWPTVPGHEILGEVDRGGMGVVYKARNPALDEVRAVKVMRVEALRTPARQERFLREMRVLARLKHPNIVPVHDARLLDGQPYFVMPLVEGGSLADHLDRFRGDPRRAARLIERVARGVDFAHSRGVYHRDLKPANILLGEGDTPLVSDFGLAGVFDAGGDEPGEGGGPAAPAGGTLAALRTTASGAVVGTLPYMSPEQVLGQAEQVGPRSDVWALGVILYELLTGERPFRGRGGEPLERRICSADPAPPSAKRPGLDRTLSAVVMRCLEKDPARRYPSAAALADDLAAWLDFRPVRGVREPWDRRLRRRARRLAPFAAVALGLGAVLALLVPVLAPDPPPGAPAPDPARAYLDAVAPQVERLRQGRPVTLVGKGVPRPAFLLRMGDGRVEMPKPEGGIQPVMLESRGPSALEFLPEVPVPAYRIRARIHRHGLYGEDSRAGVYWAYRQSQSPLGSDHLFACVQFDKAFRGDPVAFPGAPARQAGAAGARLWHFRGPEGRLDYERSSYHLHLPQAVRIVPGDPTADEPVRTFEVEVRHGGVRWVFDNDPNPLPPLTAAELWEYQSLHREGLLRKHPDIDPRILAPPPDGGGVGLFVIGTYATVYELTVEPLPEEPAPEKEER